jgi:hypothetical protein
MLPGTHLFGGAQFSYYIFLNLLYGLEKTSCFKVGLSLGNRKKSAGAKSGE